MSLKGICQAWGLNISKGISGKAQLKDLIENHAAFPEELRESLVDMVTHAQTTQKVLNKITKLLRCWLKNDKVWPANSKRFRDWEQSAVVDFVQRLETSRDLKIPKIFLPIMAWYQESIATGHNEKKGKNHPSWRQDNEVFNGARGRMCDPLGHLWKIKNPKQLTKWILKKQKKKCRGEN